MSRYHVNRKGEALPCSAKIRCRFGDLQSQHYDSAEEARAAYESSRSDTIPSLSLSPSSITETDTIIKEESVKLSALLSSTGLVNLSQGMNLDGFTFLGHGGEANVLLNESRSLVYKIPRIDEDAISCIDGGEIYLSDDVLRSHLIKQMRYAALDANALAAEGVEYVPTYFVEISTANGEKIPVQIQPYLDESEYDEVPRSKNPLETLSYEDTPRGERLRELGLQDFATSNFRQRKSDGMLVMFDCLDFDDEDYWPYSE